MNIEKKIKDFIRENTLNKVFPCTSIGIYYKNENKTNRSIIFHGNYTSEYEKKPLTAKIFFDLASLTKPFATVLSILSLIKEKKITKEDCLKNIFSNKKLSPRKGAITIAQLLSHSAGFPAHRPYYEKLIRVAPEQRQDLLLALLMREPLVCPPGSRVLYSDLGYMLLGLIIENISGLALDAYFSRMITEPIGLAEHIFYNPLASPRHQPAEFAAGEDCSWRGRMVQGEVSDENCWALGGVAGHAGLFGDIGGVLDLTALILDTWLGQKQHPNINGVDLADFLTRRTEIRGNTWALGFDTPTPGKSSSGQYLSTESVGHLGFTGASFWIDPRRRLVIVILANRVHPSRDNELIKEFRPAFHDKVIEWLGREKG